eukprot:GSMAST32.ASY1.ANO1.2195.1 assembled CDS
MLGNTGEKSTSNPNPNADENIDDRTISQLMLEQIEFANVIIVSKIPLIDGTTSIQKDKIEKIQALLKKLNPNAKIVMPQECIFQFFFSIFFFNFFFNFFSIFFSYEILYLKFFFFFFEIFFQNTCHYADLDVVKHVLETGLFDMEKAQESAGWIAELKKPEHTPETEEYGISMFFFFFLKFFF